MDNCIRPGLNQYVLWQDFFRVNLLTFISIVFQWPGLAQIVCEGGGVGWLDVGGIGCALSSLTCRFFEIITGKYLYKVAWYYFCVKPSSHARGHCGLNYPGQIPFKNSLMPANDITHEEYGHPLAM